MRLPLIIITVIASYFFMNLMEVDGEFYAECDGQADEVFVASSNSCRSYIYCMGEDSMTGECDEGQYFDGASSTCDMEENVFCRLDAPQEESEEEVTDEFEDILTTVAATTISTTSTTATTIAAETTTTPTNVTMDPHDGLHLETVVRDICPIVDDFNEIIVVPNRDSCSEYYLCYHGNAIEMYCTNQLHFNTKTGKCDFPENVHCVPNTLRPTTLKCLPYMTDYFPHPEKCNYFYYCIKGFMTIQQCPFHYGWDIERRSCVQMAQARCFAGAKRI